MTDNSPEGGSTWFESRAHTRAQPEPEQVTQPWQQPSAEQYPVTHPNGTLPEPQQEPWQQFPPEPVGWQKPWTPTAPPREPEPSTEHLFLPDPDETLALRVVKQRMAPDAYVDPYGHEDPESDEPADEPGWVLPDVPVSAWSVDTGRAAWVTRGMLLLLLLVQTAMTARLGGGASASEARLLLSTSGVDGLLAHAGLEGARLISLACALATTVLVQSTTRLLFNSRAGLAAAAVYSVLESTALAGSYATPHALSELLLAASLWALARTRLGGPAAVLSAVPFAALAPFVSHVSGLYLPMLGILAVLTAYRSRGAGAFLRGLVFSGTTVVCLIGVSAAAGMPSWSSPHGSDSLIRTLTDSAEWGGLLFAAAVLGAVAYVHRSRMGEMPWAGGSAQGAVRRSALGATMCATALVAPAAQAYLGNARSLDVHIGYGLLFAAPMAGLGISRLMGAHFRNPQLGILLYVVALVTGMAQSESLHPTQDSAAVVSALQKVVTPEGHYLAADPAVCAYYLRADTSPGQWAQAGTGSSLNAQVTSGRYDVVVLRGETVPAPLLGNKKYRLLSVLSPPKGSRQATYRIWVKR
ncbi:hypothetical protein EDD99_4787 [Streptomyces sp. 846.5]|nr:hypothetical protein [Streptomyces sp. 846.5]TDU06240.1 hypothetical protein EDD99_4787 [Streptomyces sp. 846.5]